MGGGWGIGVGGWEVLAIVLLKGGQNGTRLGVGRLLLIDDFLDGLVDVLEVDGSSGIGAGGVEGVFELSNGFEISTGGSIESSFDGDNA